MKVRILNKFHDKADYTKVYLVGETLTFDDARAEYLISMGLAECAEEVAEVVVEEAAEPIILDAEEVVPEEKVKVSKVQPIVKSSAKKKAAKAN